MDSRMSFIFVLCALTLGTVAGAADYYEGKYSEQSIVVAMPMSGIQYDKLREQVENLDILAVLPTKDTLQILVSSPFDVTFLNATLVDMGVAINILNNDDLQGAVNHHMDSMDGILESYDQLKAWWETLPVMYNGDVQVETIAISTDGRTVPAITVGPSDSKPIIVVVGGLTGRDFVSVAAAKLVIDRMLNSYYCDPVIGSFQLVFVPIANPDSLEAAIHVERFSAKTKSVEAGQMCVEHGVVIHLNFPTNYEASTGLDNTDPCSKTYRGSHVLSEPEAVGIDDFIKSLGNIEAFIELNGYVQRVTAPASDRRSLILADKVASAMSVACGQTYTAGQYTDLEKKLVGRLLSDWALSHINIRNAVTINLQDNGEKGFLIDEPDITAASDDLYKGLLTLALELKISVIDN